MVDSTLEFITVTSQDDERIKRLTEEQGTGYHIFQPSLQFMNLGARLIGPPELWIRSLTETFRYLDKVTVSKQKLADARQRAIYAYFDFLIGMLIGSNYGESERSVYLNEVRPLNQSLREVGEDVTYLGATMVGKLRLMNLHQLIVRLLNSKIPGAIVETGVWRGGASIFIRAILRIYRSPKQVILCDSFDGLPPGDKSLHIGDVGWDGLHYSKADERLVARFFHQYNLLDENVYFVKGYFNHTMLPLSQQLHEISLLRMDGDMYQSTVDVLYHLYTRVAVGGYVVIDDWEGFPARDACLDFFYHHQMSPKLIKIDNLAIYWQKTEQIQVQYWRWEQKKFKKDDIQSA